MCFISYILEFIDILRSYYLKSSNFLGLVLLQITCCMCFIFKPVDPKVHSSSSLRKQISVSPALDNEGLACFWTHENYSAEPYACHSRTVEGRDGNHKFSPSLGNIQFSGLYHKKVKKCQSLAQSPVSCTQTKNSESLMLVFLPCLCNFPTSQGPKIITGPQFQPQAVVMWTS